MFLLMEEKAQHFTHSKGRSRYVFYVILMILGTWISSSVKDWTLTLGELEVWQAIRYHQVFFSLQEFVFIQQFFFLVCMISTGWPDVWSIKPFVIWPFFFLPRTMLPGSLMNQLWWWMRWHNWAWSTSCFRHWGWDPKIHTFQTSSF